MASVPSGTAESLVVGDWHADPETQTNSDQYLARRLAAAGADYKGVALTTFVLGAAVGFGLWLAGGVLAEHWIVPGGLPRAARWGWLALGGLALVAAAFRWLVPLVRYRVNLVYAARAIEREHPDLHNDLVNTVLVKARPQGSAAVVLRSLEKRAARRLADTPVDTVIDRTPAVRLTMALATLVVLAGLYELAAPKSLLVSAARLVAPWAGLAAPSRVRIDTPRLRWRMPEAGAGAVAFDTIPDTQQVEVDRGAARIVRGRQLVIAAAIRGLRRDEKPVVHAVPLRDDGSPDPASAPWQVEMTRGAAEEAGKSFTAFLPDILRGLEAPVALTLSAGDARSDPIRIGVVDSPSLLVREVRYDFPAATGREPETVAWQGDLRAPEDTQVTLVAECNQPVEAAWIDFGCDGQRDLRMKIGASDLARATVTFPLRLNGERTAPEHSSYRLLFQPRGAPVGGREPIVVEPMEHRIEVIADLAPEVSIESPTESPLAVPRDAPVPVRVRALDPDHALSRVVIETRVEGGAVAPPIPILEAAKKGPFKGTARIVPFNRGAEAGTVLQYRAVAWDNRGPQPNATATPWQELKIDEKAPPVPEEPEPDLPNDSKKNRGDRRDQRTDRGDDGDPGPEGEGDRGEDGAENPQDRSDDGGDDGQQPRAGENPRGATGGNPGGDEQPEGDSGARQPPQGQRPEDEREGSEPDDNKAGKQGEAGDGMNPNAQPGDGNQKQPGARGQPQQGEGQQGDGGRGDGQGGQGGEKAGPKAGAQDGGRPQQREGDQGRSGEGQRDGGRSGDKGQRRDPVAADGTNDGEAMDRILEHRRREEKQGEGQKGEGQKGEGQKGEGQKGEGQKGEGQKGEGQKGEGQQGEGQKGEGQQGEGQKGEGQKGEGQKGEGQKGEGQKGEGQKGEGQKGEGKPSEGDGSEGGAGEGQPSDESAQAGGKQGGGEKGGQSPPSGSKPAGGGAQEGDQEGGGGADPKDPAAGQAGSSASPTGSGGWSNSDGPPPKNGGALEGAAPSAETEWGDQDTLHARNAADLAVRTLKEDLARGRSDLLDELGWTRDQARAFLERWEAMRTLERSNDPVKRGEYDRAVRSLGLRPDGARSNRDVPSDVKGGQAEGRRSRPPSEYREQFKAYTQGAESE